MTAANSIRAEKTKAKQTAINQSMAVAYDTFGKECRALMLKVVIVKTVVIPKIKKKRKCNISTGNSMAKSSENVSVEKIKHSSKAK